MGNHNRELRKKLAKEVENEIFTINTSIENLIQKVPSVDYKNLRKLNYNQLRNIRDKLHRLGYDIKSISRAVDDISNSHGHIIDMESGQEVIISTPALDQIKKTISPDQK